MVNDQQDEVRPAKTCSRYRPSLSLIIQTEVRCDLRSESYLGEYLSAGTAEVYLDPADPACVDAEGGEKK